MTDIHAYCREVEAYLCRRNDGHLIRVVGPAFDLVKGWAASGIPLAVVRDGIDRTVARAERPTTVRRRPVRIEFCEADVLDGFDRWRRAVGVTDAAAAAPSAKRGTLAAHVERAAVQLTALLVSDRPGPSLREAVEEVLPALGAMTTVSASARGTAREALIATLAEWDARIISVAEAELPPSRRRALTADAEHELEPFRGRLDAAQWTSAVAAARSRAVRLALGLPDLKFD